MNSTERISRLLRGQPIDRQPIYGWVNANLSKEIQEKWGSVEAFEDHYQFDAAHIFGGPDNYRSDVLEQIREENGELTPEHLVSADFFTDPDRPGDYAEVKRQISFHKQRDRFCYMQTPGFFEAFNGVFGIEDQLMWLAMDPESLGQLYRRQAEWTIRFAGHCIDCGADMIHISDDWGAQNNIMFSPQLWWELIYPNMKRVVDYVHSRGVFCSLHSDGCISKVVDGVARLGLDLVHPWQENAGMPLEDYLENYADKFAIMGGICVQSAIGILSGEDLEGEIRRVFGLLRGKRWICCTSHFVQNHCRMEDLEFAYDLIYKLARE